MSVVSAILVRQAIDKATRVVALKSTQALSNLFPTFWKILNTLSLLLNSQRLVKVASLLILQQETSKIWRIRHLSLLRIQGQQVKLMRLIQLSLEQFWVKVWLIRLSIHQMQELFQQGSLLEMPRRVLKTKLLKRKMSKRSHNLMASNTKHQVPLLQLKLLKVQCRAVNHRWWKSPPTKL